MLGSIVNAVSILICGFIGFFIGKKLSDKYKETTMQALGLAAIIIGISGAITNLQDANSHPVLFVVSLVIGGLIGEYLDIEGCAKKLGDFLESKLSKGKNSISKGFVFASVLYCVGAMSILGSIESGIKGEHNILFVKSILDGISAIMFASTMGMGVMLACVPVFLYEGGITLLSRVIEPYLTNDVIREMSIIGGVIIMGIGIDLLDIRKIKIVNFLPAIFIPAIYYLFVQ